MSFFRIEMHNFFALSKLRYARCDGQVHDERESNGIGFTYDANVLPRQPAKTLATQLAIETRQQWWAKYEIQDKRLCTMTILLRATLNRYIQRLAGQDGTEGKRSIGIILRRSSTAARIQFIFVIIYI